MPITFSGRFVTAAILVIGRDEVLLIVSLSRTHGIKFPERSALISIFSTAASITMSTSAPSLRSMAFLPYASLSSVTFFLYQHFAANSANTPPSFSKNSSLISRKLLISRLRHTWVTAAHLSGTTTIIFLISTFLPL